MINTPAFHRQLSGNARGALWMLASAATFTLMTMLIKYLGQNYHPALQTFYRQVAGLVILLPLILRDPRAAFHTTRPGILLFRAGAGTVGMVLGFYAYQMMPLADANALSFTRTLWMVPLAIFVLQEKVGMRRMAATAVGFIGTLVMLQPAGQGGMGWPAAAALTSALLVALTVTGMKVMTRDHSTTTLMAWSASLGFLLSIPPAMTVWQVPGWTDLTLLCAMGALGTITQACYIKGMTAGDASLMAPIDYTRLVFAIAFGYLLFSEVPNPTTLLGASIVIAATIYITWREARLGRPKPPPDRVE